MAGMAEEAPVEGQVIRVKPSEADVRELPLLKGLPERKQESKMKTIRVGSELLDQYPPLPDERPCQDIFWVFFFAATAIALIVYSAFNIEFLEKEDTPAVNAEISTDVTATDEAFNIYPTRLLFSALAAFIGALVTANAYLWLAHRNTECVVWAALVFSPLLLIGLGVSSFALMGVQNFITGAVLILAGVLNLTLVFCCWKKYIPFTVKMTEVVSDVISRNNCLLMVPLIGAVLSSVWSVLCVVAMIGYAVKHKVFDNLKEAPANGNGNGDADVDPLPCAMLFVYTLVFIWGSGVAYNICHMTTCGVFGRWYYKGLVGDSDSDASSADEMVSQRVRSPIAPSLKVALTTSLGSNCCGSFLVAAVRAMEALARDSADNAADSGAIVTCICACVLYCVLACIGDMLEYFNEWAYVQCAVRGTSFFQSAKITYALCTCANMKYVISDLLLDSVVSAGGMLCGLIAALAAGVTEYALSGNVYKFVLGLVIGLLIGLPIGCSALSTLGSGAKTILACWADDPEPLRVTHPEIAEEFEQRIRAGIAKGPAKRKGGLLGRLRG